MNSANLALTAGTIHHAKRMISTYLANTKQELLGNREALLIKIETTKRLSPILYNYLKSNHVAPISTKKEPQKDFLTTRIVETTASPDSSSKSNLKQTKGASAIKKGQEEILLTADTSKSTAGAKFTIFLILVAALAGLGFFLRDV